MTYKRDIIIVQLYVLAVLNKKPIEVLFSLMIYALQYFIFVYQFGNQFSDKALGNLLFFSGFGNINISKYLFNDMLIKSMCWAVASVLICELNIISRNAVFTFFIILVIPGTLNFMTSNPELWSGTDGSTLDMNAGYLYIGDCFNFGQANCYDKLIMTNENHPLNEWFW